MDQSLFPAAAAMQTGLGGISLSSAALATSKDILPKPASGNSHPTGSPQIIKYEFSNQLHTLKLPVCKYQSLLQSDGSLLLDFRTKLDHKSPTELSKPIPGMGT
ncbi:hypothetical protein CEXT_792731 [Caerostris extrusa]|uniref:Uncharacterized protein n=1 Tax=Caerostris extrusa TaxID=172846 RepID=A0AAV4XWI3_CAEEX|nr:hypothetical protein CEXT_792731 [Caerostris extrusa]